MESAEVKAHKSYVWVWYWTAWSLRLL